MPANAKNVAINSFILLMGFYFSWLGRDVSQSVGNITYHLYLIFKGHQIFNISIGCRTVLVFNLQNFWSNANYYTPVARVCINNGVANMIVIF
jgi:hypothetical protein